MHGYTCSTHGGFSGCFRLGCTSVLPAAYSRVGAEDAQQQLAGEEQQPVEQHGSERGRSSRAQLHEDRLVEGARPIGRTRAADIGWRDTAAERRRLRTEFRREHELRGRQGAGALAQLGVEAAAAAGAATEGIAGPSTALAHSAPLARRQ